MQFTDLQGFFAFKVIPFIYSAKACGLEFAGVDIMKNANGKVFVCEVNGNPGTKIIDLAGHNYFVDLVKLIQSKVNKEDNEKETESSTKANITRLNYILENKRRYLYISKDDKTFLIEHSL